MMIARAWSGVTSAEDSAPYLEYLRETGVGTCRRTPGNEGVYVLRKVEADRATFLFLSLWESMEAVKRFAGGAPERAVFYPEDERYLLERDEGVEHWEVLVRPDGAGGPRNEAG